VLSSIPDPEERGMMVFAWWFTCLCDAYASAYYRRKPQIEDDDYDVDFYTVEPLPDKSATANGDEGANGVAANPREHLEVRTFSVIKHVII
jgi:hypothetical protein